jgi:hypothetical protein
MIYQSNVLLMHHILSSCAMIVIYDSLHDYIMSPQQSTSNTSPISVCVHDYPVRSILLYDFDCEEDEDGAEG